MAQRQLTPDQWNQAVDLWNQGFSLSRIAHKLGVTLDVLAQPNGFLGVLVDMAKAQLESEWRGQIVLPETAKRSRASA